jgi:hypothetical protein
VVFPTLTYTILDFGLSILIANYALQAGLAILFVTLLVFTTFAVS